MTPRPYREIRSPGGRILREFRLDVDSNELIWHQDLLERQVRVISAGGWKLQLEAGLPFDLLDGVSYVIPARSWHRVIKGHDDLTIEITEFEPDVIINTGKRRNHA